MSHVKVGLVAGLFCVNACLVLPRAGGRGADSHAAGGHGWPPPTAPVWQQHHGICNACCGCGECLIVEH
jgi:hypothetical protein